MMLKSLNMNLSVSLLNGDNSKLNKPPTVRACTTTANETSDTVYIQIHQTPKPGVIYSHWWSKNQYLILSRAQFFLILIICAWYTTTTTVSNCTTLKVMPSMLPIYISTDEIAIKRRENNNSHWWWCLFLHKHFYVFLSRLCGAWEAEMDRNVGIISVLAPSTSYVMDPNSQFR